MSSAYLKFKVQHFKSGDLIENLRLLERYRFQGINLLQVPD